jgi:hypothetical protein
MIDREAILRIKRPQRTVDIPDWNGSVTVRAITAGEYLALVQKMKDDKDHAVFLWIIAAACNDDGSPLFKDDDLTFLEGQPYKVIEALLEPILELNPQKDVAAKNLKTLPQD